MRSRSWTQNELIAIGAAALIVVIVVGSVFARIREQGRRAACVTNMHELARAWLLYAQDTDESLPGAVDGPASAGAEGGWVFVRAFPANRADRGFEVTRGTLYHYVKDPSFYQCPTDGEGAQSGNSYAANGCVESRTGPGASIGRPLTFFEKPALWAMLCEESADSSGGGSTDDGYLEFPRGSLTTRHSGGSVLAFVDGHSKWHSSEEIKAGSFLTGGLPGADCPR